MFMVTAKLNKRKLVFAFAAVVILIVALFIIFNKDDSVETALMSKVVKNNEERIEYLNSFGWEVDSTPIEEESIVIPRKLSSVYEEYNKIQQTQGFDLSEFGGMEAVRYTYKVLNYPDADNVVADIIVFRNEVIAADVQSTSLDGFMHGLKLPE